MSVCWRCGGECQGNTDSPGSETDGAPDDGTGDGPRAAQNVSLHEWGEWGQTSGGVGQ